MNLTDEDGIFGFSEELYELDRNTAYYMVDRLRKESELLTRQKTLMTEVLALRKENLIFEKALNKNLETRKFILTQQNLVLTQLKQKEQELATIEQELEDFRQNP